MTQTTRTRTLRIGHSPDPDDAFMWYPLADFPDGSGPGGRTYTPRIDTGPYRFEHVLEDIESLNRRSARGELEITALSIHQYPFIADRYALTSCGSSMGDGYGPMIVSREPLELGAFVKDGSDGRGGACLAMPGERTTAWLAFQLMMAERGDAGPGRAIDHAVVPFDQIIPRVASGEFAAGLIIHEGQLTYAEAGLRKLVDLGAWWAETRRLPLPLGGNAIRRDLAAESPAICRILYDSIRYALDHRAESIAYALNYARDMGTERADEFVGMYVNDYTLHYGERGREAVRRLLGEASAAGLIPEVGEVDVGEPAGGCGSEVWGTGRGVVGGGGAVFAGTIKNCLVFLAFGQPPGMRPPYTLMKRGGSLCPAKGRPCRAHRREANPSPYKRRRENMFLKRLVAMVVAGTLATGTFMMTGCPEDRPADPGPPPPDAPADPGPPPGDDPAGPPQPDDEPLGPPPQEPDDPLGPPPDDDPGPPPDQQP